MGFETDLLVGLAQLLVAAGIGSWKTNGVYTSGETGIFIDALPPAPDRAISLTDYVVADSASLSDSILGVQIRTRWSGQDPRPVKDLDNLIFNLLHGMPAQTLPTGVKVVSCFRRSGASMGPDQNNRYGRTSNFYVSVYRPSTNRT